MKTTLAPSQQALLRVCGWIAASAMAASALGAQSVAPRIASAIDSSETSTLKGSLHPLAQAKFDAGRMPATTKLAGISIVFNRSAEQEADLKALIAAQQNPASPLYHQWLNPDQFAARFGMAASDIATVESWLQHQGFSIDSVARSRNMIHFSGTVGQVEQTFSTEMHYYQYGSVRNFAPSTELSVPAALASVVVAVRNLSDFRPKAMHTPVRAVPAYTSSQSGTVHFAPGDIKVAYNIPSTSTGTGQSIAIMGQSAIALGDIENFQSAAGLTVKDPALVLVPGTGSSRIFEGDESESDIDLEWSGGIATGANIVFVYVGSNENYSVFDSYTYAVDEDIAPIISISYGSCETELDQSDINSLEPVGEQAVAQGQTVVVSSGDSGSTSCYGDEGMTIDGSEDTLSDAQAVTPAVNYPASSQYVTAAGGTEVTSANSVSTNSTYWDAQGSSDIVNSLKAYIPEVAWNDDTLSATSGCGTECLSATGGGVSTFIARPSWQTGTIGGVPLPSSTYRLVPDISFYSSPNYPGYLFCSSDPSNDITGSCDNGFRDADDEYLTIAGGTSFAAPVFAGMVAILNQASGNTNGQGLINTELYSLASSNYASIFHDVTAGSSAGTALLGNQCTAGATICASGGESAAETEYPTATGYDEATGLGSVNLGSLVSAWPASSSALIGTSTSIAAQYTSPTANENDTLTITVTSASSGTTPSGYVLLSIDGGGTTYNNNGSVQTAELAAGSTAGTATATYSVSFASGTHEIVAYYPCPTSFNGKSTTCPTPPANFASSSGSVQVTVPAAGSSGTGTFTLAASPSTLTVAQGSQGTETITVTPASGYTGLVLMSLDSSNDAALTNLCFYATTVIHGSAAVSVPSTSAVTTQLTLDTNAADCEAAKPVGGQPFRVLSRPKTAKNNAPNPAPLGIAFAGLLLAGFLGRYSLKFRNIAGVVALLAVGLAISACGGGNTVSNNSTSSTGSNPPTGTYTITVSAQDAEFSSITAQTTFTFVIN